jgi:hypothetical protein
MPMIRKLAAIMLLAVVSAPPAHTQTVDCAWYADTSLKQHQQNELKKCGFEGPEWSPSRQAHLAWCATRPPDAWKAVAQKRQQMLAGCKP